MHSVILKTVPTKCMKKGIVHILYICKLLLAQGCKGSWILNTMELRLSSLCAFVFILMVSLKYVPLYVGDVRSQFVYVQCKQEAIVTMRLYIWVFRSLLSAILKENVRKIISKNSGYAGRWILWCFEFGFWNARDSYRPAGCLQALKNLLGPRLWSHQEPLCELLTSYKEISCLSMEFTV